MYMFYRKNIFFKERHHKTLDTIDGVRINKFQSDKTNIITNIFIKL